MTRVKVIVEGPTEEAFIAGPLYQALLPYGVFITPIIIGEMGHKGGYVTYRRLRKDVILTLKQDPGCACTTLVDYYGLGGGFPATSLNASATAHEAVTTIEQAILADLVGEIPECRPDVRCIPYIQLHEFEGLLFSDAVKLSEAVYAPTLAGKLQTIRASFATPEDINNSRETAPSKRLMRTVPGYNKVLHGSLAAEHIGIDSIRQACPRFSAWFDRLAGLGA